MRRAADIATGRLPPVCRKIPLAEMNAQHARVFTSPSPPPPSCSADSGTIMVLLHEDEVIVLLHEVGKPLSSEGEKGSQGLANKSQMRTVLLPHPKPCNPCRNIRSRAIRAAKSKAAQCTKLSRCGGAWTSGRGALCSSTARCSFLRRLGLEWQNGAHCARALGLRTCTRLRGQSKLENYCKGFASAKIVWATGAGPDCSLRFVFLRTAQQHIFSLHCNVQYHFAGFHSAEERRERRWCLLVGYQQRKWGRGVATVGELARSMPRMSVGRAGSGADGALPWTVGVICIGTDKARESEEGNVCRRNRT